MNRIEFDLRPQHTNQKSFYGKARVTQTSKGSILTSYNTDVAAYANGFFTVIKDESKLTNTTMKHIKSFQVLLGLEPQSKKELLKK